MFDQTRDVTVLNSLIASVLDSIDGYQKAAEDAAANRFTEMFNARARERQSVVADLQAAVASAGGQPEDVGTLLAGAHRAFMGLKDAVTGRDDAAIIAEVERGEDHLKAKFEDALGETDLSTTARAAIESAWSSVRAGHDEARDLKHAFSATNG